MSIFVPSNCPHYNLFINEFNPPGAFDDDDVTHIEGEVNPIRDLDIISEELRLKDQEFLMAHLDKLEKTVGRGGDKKLKPEYVSIYVRWLNNFSSNILAKYYKNNFLYSIKLLILFSRTLC